MASGKPTPPDVARAARALGRELSPEQASGLAVYLGLLETWNRRTNLVGPSAWPDMLASLVADSWNLADLLRDLSLPETPLTLDFGAGAGIPGVPLRLFWQAGRYVLIEPRAKRAGFLRQCLALMRLTNTEVFEGRAEDLRLTADLCLSRAFQPWRVFLATAERFAGGRGAGPAVGGGEARLPEGAEGIRGACRADSADAPSTSKVIVFAGEAGPDGPVPDGWRLTRVAPYPRQAGKGYFWVFEPSISFS
jgi:16S rRNA (guanine527-N7)-methyltransferase